ncbi:hypothetical protein AA313_de0209008 [Arthrobotrys entomopaga]|nr:hypothetical protein AA313_de0209008 [Arthrobotrys entomopaga]
MSSAFQQQQWALRQRQHPRPISMPYQVKLRDRQGNFHDYDLRANQGLLKAFIVAERIYIEYGGLEVLAELGEKALMPYHHQEAYDRAFATEHVYAFFFAGTDRVLFPKFAVDRRMDSLEEFGHHSRQPDYDRNFSRFIMLNAGLVEAAATNPPQDIPVFKLVHTIMHEIPHAFLSYLFAITGHPETNSVRLDTPPELNYLSRYVNAADQGEAGFWFDRKIWGGAVFYYGMTSHTTGNPCIYRRDDDNENPANMWVQLSSERLGQILRPYHNPHLPVNYVAPNGDYIRGQGRVFGRADGGIPRLLKAEVPRASRMNGMAGLNPFYMEELRDRVRVA